MKSMVVDASALVVAATETTPAARRVRNRMRLESCHAPHLVDAEVGNALRRMVSAGELAVGTAATILERLDSFVDWRYEHTGNLARAAWALRHNVTFYDGLYVALAAALRVPLVTADRRLAASPGLPCAVEVVR